MLPRDDQQLQGSDGMYERKPWQCRSVQPAEYNAAVEEIEDLEARLRERVRREGIYERALKRIAETPHTGSPYYAWEWARDALREAEGNR